MINEYYRPSKMRNMHWNIIPIIHVSFPPFSNHYRAIIGEDAANGEVEPRPPVCLLPAERCGLHTRVSVSREKRVSTSPLIRSSRVRKGTENRGAIISRLAQSLDHRKFRRSYFILIFPVKFNKKINMRTLTICCRLSNPRTPPELKKITPLKGNYECGELIDCWILSSPGLIDAVPALK